MNNDNDNLRKLAFDSEMLSRLKAWTNEAQEVADGKWGKRPQEHSLEWWEGRRQVLYQLLAFEQQAQSLTPVPLDRGGLAFSNRQTPEESARLLFSIFSEKCDAVLGHSMGSFDDIPNPDKQVYIETATQFSALLPRDGGACEWQIGDVLTGNKISCLNAFFFVNPKMAGWQFCPFCGKTIKEVK